MSYSDVLGHRDMAFDPVRNAAYMAALERWVTPDSVVLDLGCGLGSHGLYAARLGARKVYLVDPEVVVHVAEEVARANGFGDRVQAFRGTIEEIQLPEQVDLIISVFTGNILYSEDLLPSLYLARDRWLRPGGRLIPDFAELLAAPVSASAHWRREVATWSDPRHGIDYAGLRRFAPNAMISVRCDVNDGDAPQPLANPIVLERADFHRATGTDLDARFEATISCDGACHGLLTWIRFRCDETWLETGPAATMHWTPQLLPVDPPIEVAASDRLVGRLLRRTYGEWTWTLRVGSEERRHSTFLGQPLRAKELAAAAVDATLPLNDQGRVAFDVLQGFATGQSNGEIAERLCRDHADRFPRGHEEAMQLVKGLALAYRSIR